MTRRAVLSRVCIYFTFAPLWSGVYHRARVSHAFWTLPLISAYLRAGEIASGLAVVAELLEHVARWGDRFNEAYSWLLHGQLLLAGGNGDEHDAELSMHKALVTARKQSAKLPELAATAVLAQLWQ